MDPFCHASQLAGSARIRRIRHWERRHNVLRWHCVATWIRFQINYYSLFTNIFANFINEINYGKIKSIILIHIETILPISSTFCRLWQTNPFPEVSLQSVAVHLATDPSRLALTQVELGFG